MNTRVCTALILSAILFSASGARTVAQEKTILVQSTTSTANSGLYEHLLPQFFEASGITVRVVAVGTGQAIRNAQNCDADVLLVHSKPAEEKFVRSGFGVKRFDLMYNDFVIVGPKGDPAQLSGVTDVETAFTKISATKTPFASRGDDSGTHKKEQEIWATLNIQPKGDWYKSTGSGMGATLNVAIGIGAYAMTDRATWTKFGNKANHEILVQGDAALLNQYGVILVNSDKCPNVETRSGQRFVDWLTSPAGQQAIGSYRVNGQQLFFPNSKPRKTQKAR